MDRQVYSKIGSAICAIVLLALVFAPLTVAAQGGATNIKTAANLAPPDGAANTNAKGKAKTLYRDNGNNILQKLTITLQKVDRRTDYRILIDGIELGVFSPKGNSGTVTARFRTPAKGNQDAVPVELGEVRDFVLIEVFNDETGELALTGTFALQPEE